MTAESDQRLTLDDHLPADFTDAALRADVPAGLTARPKWLPPKWFYDKRRQRAVRGDHPAAGVLPDPDRAARSSPGRPPRSRVASRRRDAGRAGLRLVGEDPAAARRAARRRRAASLRRAGRQRGRPADAAARPGRRLPGPGGARACVADFTHQLDLLPPATAPRLIVVPRRHDRQLRTGRARRVPARAARRLDPGDMLLLGTDLVKSPARPGSGLRRRRRRHREFNLNVLRRAQPRAGRRFRRDAFEHVALWDERAEWIEMRLRAQDHSASATRARPDRRLRRRRGHPHRDLGQVPPRRRARRTRRRRSDGASLVGGRSQPLRAVPLGA